MIRLRVLVLLMPLLLATGGDEPEQKPADTHLAEEILELERERIHASEATDWSSIITSVGGAVGVVVAAVAGAVVMMRKKKAKEEECDHEHDEHAKKDEEK